MFAAALLFVAVLAAPSSAQDGTADLLISSAGPEADVRAVTDAVVRLFDGMRTGDSAVVRDLFHPEARLLTMLTREGAPALAQAEVDAFVEMVGSPHDQVFDERIANLEVRVDENLALAWMDYAFYLGEQFSHCGVNLFQFVRTRDRWKIISIADTRRRTDCGV